MKVQRSWVGAYGFHFAESDFWRMSGASQWEEEDSYYLARGREDPGAPGGRPPQDRAPGTELGGVKGSRRQHQGLGH